MAKTTKKEVKKNVYTGKALITWKSFKTQSRFIIYAFGKTPDKIIEMLKSWYILS